MTDIDDDPFAPKTPEPVVVESTGGGGGSGAPATAPVVKVSGSAKAPGEGKLVTTLKGGASFTDPWIVLHAESLEETEEFFSEENAKRVSALMERVQNAGKHFVKLGGGSTPSAQAAPAQPRSNAPAAAQSAPDGDSRQCKHGEMVYRTGSKNGRTWKAFMCPSPKGTPDQCDAEWIR
ncbi:Uncharacterised protein [Mycobacteroides abscessus subsp. abscessus]|uniref:hypothetical protein n=1 Tax=Mycobacteroides abscessus TaxID=36809 RepID=UPI00092BC914|nr:hypothetical protein [Mycobacteroides abscessus]SIG87555.1 Uncharacterised protein [Mycobacteroides abscessus subsp. abscessus]SIG98673.1 Uncharacterised protein [Mycobacteroides abscessus subsp. abscessus]